MFSEVSYARHQTLGWCLSRVRLSAGICKQTLCWKMSISAICPHPHAVRWTSLSIFRMRRTVAEVETFWNVSGTDCHLVSVTRKRGGVTTQSALQVDVPPPLRIYEWCDVTVSLKFRDEEAGKGKRTVWVWHLTRQIHIEWQSKHNYVYVIYKVYIQTSQPTTAFSS